MKILPGRPMPDITLPAIGKNSTWRLAEKPRGKYRLLVVYRGHHCPLCKKQLESIAQQLAEFESRKVDVIALSCDNEGRATKSYNEWQVDGVPIAYGLPVDEALNWGLFVSTAVKDVEPDLFSEPGLFLLDEKSEVRALWVQSVPFARPSISDILQAIDFIEENSYPPRGTVEHAQNN